MGKTGRKRGKFGQINGRTLSGRLAEFLRTQHPVKTAQCVEAETGISAETVRKWLDESSLPSGKAILVLFRRYRFTFLSNVLGEDADAQVAELARLEEQERLEHKAAVIRQQLAVVMEGRAR